MVDDHDVPIDLVERSHVFDVSANFRTVHVLLFDQAERILLQRLAATRARHPLRWGSSVAGYLHAGESYADAAERRIFEELGVEAALGWVGRTAMKDEGSTKFVGVFDGETASTGPRICEPDHIERLWWANLDEVDGELRRHPERMTPTFRHVLEFWKGNHRHGR